MLLRCKICSPKVCLLLLQTPVKWWSLSVVCRPGESTSTDERNIMESANPDSKNLRTRSLSNGIIVWQPSTGRWLSSKKMARRSPFFWISGVLLLYFLRLVVSSLHVFHELETTYYLAFLLTCISYDFSWSTDEKKLIWQKFRCVSFAAAIWSSIWQRQERERNHDGAAEKHLGSGKKSLGAGASHAVFSHHFRLVFRKWSVLSNSHGCFIVLNNIP